METELVTRYRALPEAKRTQYQEFMKPVRAALIRRYQYQLISPTQFAKEYDAAGTAVLAILEVPSDNQE